VCPLVAHFGVKPDEYDDYPGYDDQDQYDTYNGTVYDSGDAGNQETFTCYCDWWCWYVSYDETLEWLQETHDWWGNDERVWMWQTCTMWGYQISTNYGRNMFVDSLPINHLIDYCPDIFGDDYNRTRLDNGVRDTNWRYGGQDNYNGTNVMFVNGSEDPWHVLSVFGPHMPLNPNGNVTKLYINGTSHCQDMWKWEPGDVPVVKTAHRLIKDKITDWVEQSKPPSN